MRHLAMFGMLAPVQSRSDASLVTLHPASRNACALGAGRDTGGGVVDVEADGSGSTVTDAVVFAPPPHAETHAATRSHFTRRTIPLTLSAMAKGIERGKKQNKPKLSTKEKQKKKKEKQALKR
jgi:hypothetical protein